jgi:DNA-binding response OmpR family regulator/DNA-binding CsgD family transcriptional regulator
MEITSGKNILVVEDERDIRESICEILGFEGYTVVCAENGSQGLDEIRKSKPDLILCDIMMPDMDGFEMMIRMKKLFPNYEIPLVYITALSDRKDYRSAMSLGADDYITKPFTVEELINSVRIRLEKSQSVEKRIQQELERIEESINERTSQLAKQLRSQSKEIAKISKINTDLEDKLIQKEQEVAREALRVIDINNSLQNIERVINIESQRWDISDIEKKTLVKLKSRINNRNLFVNNWTVFQMQFNKTHPEFLSRLSTKFPKLTHMELTLACGMAINLSTDQLANMFNIMPESIRKSKYRLKQKMGLDSEANLLEYIHKFKVDSE